MCHHAKTVDTGRHCKVGLRAYNNLPQPNKDIGRGLRKIGAILNNSLQCLLVSKVFGMVSFLRLTSSSMLFHSFFKPLHS